MATSGLDEGIPCRHSGCPGQGTWTPIMVMQIRGERKAVRGTIPEIKICEMHKSESTLDSFLSSEAWVKIEKFLRENGKGSFLRRNVSLDWRRNEDAALLPF